MNNAKYCFALDIHRADSQIRLTARRGETGRVLRISLTERSLPYAIGLGCIGELAVKLPDGTLLKNACTVTGDQLSYKLTTLTTAQSGILECELRLLDYNNELLVSPRFTIAVYDTVYNDGDAVTQEGPSANTVKSSEPGYSQVFLWSDGNPLGENRLCRFVTCDRDRSSAMIRTADSRSPVIGVAAAIPGFAADAGQDRFDGSGVLGDAYEYVTMLGFAPVEDAGRCTVNGWCRSDDEGRALPCEAGGFYVVERIDASHVTVLITATADLEVRLNRAQATKQNLLDWVTTADLDAMLDGAYTGTEDQDPAGPDAILFALAQQSS